MHKTIGYFPFSDDLSHPGDRRRIGRWSKLTGTNLILKPQSKVDLCVFSEAASLREIKLSKSHRILDLIDPYIIKDNFIMDIARSINKKIQAKEFDGRLRHSSNIKEICSFVDTVICSSPEQANLIEKYNKNVHIILDFHDEIPNFEFSKSMNTKLNILWEGQSATFPSFLNLVPVFNTLSDHIELNFNLVTDKILHRYANKYFKSDIDSVVKRSNISDNIKISISEWSIDNLRIASQNSNLAIVPVNLNNSIHYLKPENRLLIMWRLGLPAIVSKNPAHARVSQAIGIDFTCVSNQDWAKKIRSTVEEPSLFLPYGQKAKQYLVDNHASEKVLEKWNKILAT